MKTYISNFLKRDGLYVFSTTIISRLLSFLTSWIALQFIDNDILGIVLYAWNIITFLIPFIGLGLPQSLIRYGALANANEKKSLLYYVVKNGTFSSILLVLIVSTIALVFPFDFNLAGIYTATLSIVLIPFFWLETIKIQLRLLHNNKKFSIVDLTYNIILCLLVLVLSFVFQEKGYITAILIAPTLTSLIFSKTINIKKSAVKTLTTTNIEFWKYGIFGGLSNAVTILLFAIDILLIGSILKSPEEVTAFRYISLVPFSLLFLPRTFIATDFVSFTEKITSKEHIKNYIKRVSDQSFRL